MKILGLSCFYHDSSAALITDGYVAAACQEERFTRQKHDPSIPINSINFCLNHANLELSDLDAVVFYENPALKFHRVLANAVLNEQELSEFNRDTILDTVRKKLSVNDDLRKCFGRIGKIDKLYYVNHHISHASSAFYPSPFDESSVLTVDGVGEWNTTSLGYGKSNTLTIFETIDYPHSLGLLYSAFTSFCGFKVNSGEYKLMGLAPYGNPIYSEIIENEIITLHDDGSFSLNLEYFSYMHSEFMLSRKFNNLFEGGPRRPETRITRREIDLAASIQTITEKIIFKLLNRLYNLTKNDNLVLSGGVALNCVCNGKIRSNSPFNNIWVQPASGDAGTSVGAALYYYHKYNSTRIPEKYYSTLLGPSYKNTQIEDYLIQENCVYEEVSCEDKLSNLIASNVSKGKVIGHFNGRMEFGPRALGSRSIIGDPRNTEMQSKMNLKIKYRESFRPFAPIVLESFSQDYFKFDSESPYMLMVAPIKQEIMLENRNIEKLDIDDLLATVNQIRSTLPAITHVDYSARLQTVNENQYPRMFKILNAFHEQTGCPVLINTSFNVRGEPIVCTPEDAYICFMRTGMDMLILNNFVLHKEDQKEFSDDEDWRNEFVLD
jgi:carbamoyltransferase